MDSVNDVLCSQLFGFMGVCWMSCDGGDVMKRVIVIDATVDKHPKYKEFTVMGAIAAILEKIPAGGEVLITRVINAMGREVPREYHSIYMCRVGRAMKAKFKTRFTRSGTKVYRATA